MCGPSSDRIYGEKMVSERLKVSLPPKTATRYDTNERCESGGREAEGEVRRREFGSEGRREGEGGGGGEGVRYSAVLHLQGIGTRDAKFVCSFYGDLRTPARRGQERNTGQ